MSCCTLPMRSVAASGGCRRRIYPLSPGAIPTAAGAALCEPRAPLTPRAETIAVRSGDVYGLPVRPLGATRVDSAERIKYLFFQRAFLKHPIDY
jgi:hypothetical protein